MGFDLSMIRHPAEDSLYGYPTINRKSPGYFRGVPWDTMDAAGIFDHDAATLGSPDWPPVGLRKARAEQLLLLFEPRDDPVISLLDVKPTYRELRVMQNYLTECGHTRSVRSRKQGRVPSIKFNANDGFVVTPEECLIIAYRLRVYLAKESPVGDEDLKWVEGFVAFNEVAAMHEGVSVR